MSRDSFFVPGADGFRGRVCLRGRPSFRGRVCLRAGTSDRCAPAVLSLPPLRGGPRSRSHGRLRRPKSLPIRHSPAAAQCRPPLGGRDCPCFDLMAASIRKSGPEIKNRCTDCPRFDLLAASIRKSGLEIKNRCMDCPCFELLAASIRKFELEIKNRCNTIVPASITARLLQVVAATMPRPILFSLPQSRTVPLAEGYCRYDDASVSNFFAAKQNGSPAAKSCGAGGDRMPRRRHNPK